MLGPAFCVSLFYDNAGLQVADDPGCACDIVIMNPPWGQQRRSADRPFLQAQNLPSCSIRNSCQSMTGGFYSTGKDVCTFDAQLVPQMVTCFEAFSLKSCIDEAMCEVQVRSMLNHGRGIMDGMRTDGLCLG